MSCASQVSKIARPIRSRAASTRSVIALPFGVIAASRTRRSAAFPRALHQTEAFELCDLAADGGVIAPHTVGHLHDADRAETLDAHQQRKQRAVQSDTGFPHHARVVLGPVHHTDDLQKRAMEKAELSPDMCILHFLC